MNIYLSYMIKKTYCFHSSGNGANDTYNICNIYPWNGANDTYSKCNISPGNGANDT